MTKLTPFTLHVLSIVLMVVTLQLGFWLLGNDTMMIILTAIGSVTFGWGWKRATDYLIDKHD